MVVFAVRIFLLAPFHISVRRQWNIYGAGWRFSFLSPPYAAVSAGAERLRCVDLFTQEVEKISSGYLSESAVRKMGIMQEFIISLNLNTSCFRAAAWDNGFVTTNMNEKCVVTLRFSVSS